MTLGRFVLQADMEYVRLQRRAKLYRLSNMRYIQAIALVTILGIGTIGYMNYPFAQNKLDNPRGNTSMTSSPIETPIETFDGAWAIQKAKDIDLTQFDSLRFDFDAGTLYGSGPCRGFKTTFGPDTQNLMFSPLEIGGGMCDEQTMIIERDFFKQISIVTRLEIDSDGQLIMSNFDTPLLWAKRIIK
jgi:heat shock protein HslJ